MKCEWQLCTIGDLGKIVTGKTPSTKNKLFWGGEIPFITPGDIQTEKHIVHTERYITDAGVNSVKGAVIPPNSICVSCIGNVGYVGMTTRTSITNQQINSVVVEKENDPDYVYYLMKSLWNFFKNYEGQSTTLSILNKTGFSKIEVRLPHLHIQKKISSILSSLDDKIELNNAMNKNLEQQAQAVYQQMFITNINPAWRRGNLSDLITVKYGKDHKKLADGAYPVFGSGGIIRYAERYLYDKESVLIPRKGSLNNVIYVNEPFWSVDTMFYTVMRRPNVVKYVYHFVKSIDFAFLDSGSAVPSMTANILNALKVAIPNEEILSNFEDIVSPMYDYMRKNDLQSSALAKFRDALLPKLMSGAIDVSSLDF